MDRTDLDMKARIVDFCRKTKQPDQPLELGDLVLTPRQILRHIQERTEVAEMLIARWKSMISKYRN